MGRTVIGVCAAAGLFVGGYLPQLWGGGLFASVLVGAVGGIGGVWLGLRLSGE